MSQTLIIASLSSIQAPSSPFPSLLTSQSPSPEHHLFDRFILPSVTPIPSASITKIHVVLTDKDLTGFKSGELESIIKRSWSVLKEGGELEWITLGDVVEIKENLEKGGFKVTKADNNLVTAVSLPLPTTSVPLKLRKKNTQTNGTTSLWSISPSVSNESEQLIDEDSLLSAEDLERPKLVAREDCDPDVKKRKKRCKNCTCGLKDMVLEEDDDLPENLKGGGKQRVNGKAITSSCGSCYLGDAFRCSSCPYLGLPPFKPGEKVEIPLGSDDIDI